MQKQTTSRSNVQASLSGLLRRLVVPVLAAFSLQLASPVIAQVSQVPSIGDDARTALTPIQEYKLGRYIMVQIERDPAYVKDDVLNEYLFTLGNRLIAADPTIRGELVNDFTFFGVKDRTLNAFALPGGFIGVHTGLILATETESELASVLSHEIGHVSQRHIARMIASSKNDILIPLASAALGLLVAAAGGGTDAALGSLLAGQGVAIQKQINFTREAEKEADRVGYQILKHAGFDVNDMAGFFAKMQHSNRLYNDAPSQYLRTHPLTSDRIADVQARAMHEPYRQHVDSADFQLIRAKARVVQGDMGGGLHEVERYFAEQVKNGTRYQVAAGYYGLALVALERKQPDLAQQRLDVSRKMFSEMVNRQSSPLNVLAVQIAMEKGNAADAVRITSNAIDHFPSSRAISNLHIEALAKAKRYDECQRFIRKMVRRYPEDAGLRKKSAEVYAGMGKKGASHLSMGEYYHLMQMNEAAVEQLRIARSEKDTTFYEHSLIDAHERAWKEEIKEEKKNK